MLNIQIPQHPQIKISSFENEIILPTKNLLQNFIDKVFKHLFQNYIDTVFQHLFQSFQEEHSSLIKTNKEYIQTITSINNEQTELKAEN